LKAHERSKSDGWGTEILVKISKRTPNGWVKSAIQRWGGGGRRKNAKNLENSRKNQIYQIFVRQNGEYLRCPISAKPSPRPTVFSTLFPPRAWGVQNPPAPRNLLPFTVLQETGPRMPQNAGRQPDLAHVRIEGISVTGSV